MPEPSVPRFHRAACLHVQIFSRMCSNAPLKYCVLHDAARKYKCNCGCICIRTGTATRAVEMHMMIMKKDFLLSKGL